MSSQRRREWQSPATPRALPSCGFQYSCSQPDPSPSPREGALHPSAVLGLHSSSRQSASGTTPAAGWCSEGHLHPGQRAPPTGLFRGSEDAPFSGLPHPRGSDGAVLGWGWCQGAWSMCLPTAFGPFLLPHHLHGLASSTWGLQATPLGLRTGGWLPCALCCCGQLHRASASGPSFVKWM